MASVVSKRGTLTVSLKPGQGEHVQRLIDILSNNVWAMDNSVPGSGKTHTTSYLAQYFKFPAIVVVCPATVESVWREATARYGLPTLAILSYEFLRGTKNHVLGHQFLERVDNPKMTVFRGTAYLNKVIQDGCFFIFDECQKMKNLCDIHYAVKEIVARINEIQGRSRFILLSGTVFDKEDQVVNFLRLLGVIKKRSLYTTSNTGMLRSLGISELQKYCQTFDPATTARILSRNVISKSTAEHICYLLYTEVVQKHLVSSMPSPEIAVGIDCKNGYYNMSEERAANLSSYLEGLHSASCYNEKTEEVNMADAKWGAITHSLAGIELQKVEIFVRRAIEILEAMPNAKVLLFFNYKLPLITAASLLVGYNPLVLSGCVNKKLRPGIIAQFQESTPEHRLLISNLTVASLGIDLDDKTGEWPRYVFVSPSYYAMNLHQVTRRVYRVNTLSQPTIRFVYGKCGQKETSIINALSRKKDVMKATLDQQRKEGVKFPGEYENEEEPLSDLRWEIDYASFPEQNADEPEPISSDSETDEENSN